MNYKLLFPTYRNRYLFVEKQLNTLLGQGKFGRILNLGTGEGDYDPMIATYADKLIACDINERDIAFARQLNSHLANVEYRVENALSLSFDDNTMDAVVSVDVIEHVGEPWTMLAEVARVLKPGGYALITFPQLFFPWTYDPINRLLSFFTDRRIAQGAYAFGHTYLIDPGEFANKSKASGLRVLDEVPLTGHWAALPEMYWTGLVQRLLKDNAANVESTSRRRIIMRPGLKPPGAVVITDFWCSLDRQLAGRGKYSVGRGFVLKKD